ncbi:MAG: hypothetical protein AAFO76_15010, partial [Cyanobacteria bacterium J06607_15]
FLVNFPSNYQVSRRSLFWAIAFTLVRVYSLDQGGSASGYSALDSFDFDKADLYWNRITNDSFLRRPFIRLINNPYFK